MKPKELKDKIKGIIHLVVSPFDKNGQLDEKTLRKSLNYAADALEGWDAVFLATGSTAEFYAMTGDECEKAIRITVEEVGGKFPVIAGTGRPGTKLTIEMSQSAQNLGADGVLIVSPYYQPATKEGLFRHFKEVAENIDIGIMIYNNPATSKLWIPPDLMARLSKIENIIADKENTTNAVAYYWMQKAVDPKDMVIICGIGQLMYTFCAVYGCPGFVTELTKYQQFLAELAQKRSAIPTVLSPYISSGELTLYQTVIKEAMSLIGLPSGAVREPMENLTAGEKQELRKVLTDMGIL
jgi:4-hydroxy-tetrahydrodipicolinate synthase